jgi:epoxide hydrolase-like predicted phosphatase
MASEDGAAGDRYRGLLVDWGGVMTSNLFSSFSAFCEGHGLDPDTIRRSFRDHPDARKLLIGLETGAVPESDFEPRLAAMLGVSPTGLIDRLFAGSSVDPRMVDAVVAARRAGTRTGLISNSWGTRRYDRDLLAELFDGVVISGEEGTRKPDPRMYELGAKRIGVEPSACVFVDDLPFNLTPAAELGMATIHHVSAEQTIPQLERLLGVPLGGTAVTEA